MVPLPRAGSKSFTGPPHVALLIETSLASGRDILQGIARYTREHGPWSLYHQPRSLEEKLPIWLKTWKGDGIIARVQTPAMARAINQTGRPVVDVLGVVEGGAFPLVHVDNEVIGELAAGHLLERGLRSFAYLGIRGENWSAARQRAFSKAVAQHGHQVTVRNEPRHDLDDESWEAHQTKLAQWLARLSRPVGIMVCSDQRGSQLLDACRRAGLRVPNDVAVIGVDNDEPLCNVCNPPLSSVLPGHMEAGYQAAALLDRLMRGAKTPAKPTVIAPIKIVTRHSTDTVAVEDEVVGRALCIIREQFANRIRIDEIAAKAGVSRSVLQRRFRATLRRTINDELIHHRLKLAQQLLIETELPVLEIAERTGFQHVEYMGAVFRTKLQTTPGALRRKLHEFHRT